MSCYWKVAYYRGQHDTLCLANLCDGTSYEESDYRLASNKRFDDEEEAAAYARELAKKNGLKLFGDELLMPILDEN